MNNDEENVGYLYGRFVESSKGFDSYTTMIALGAYYSELVTTITTEPSRIRAMFDMMASAAICLSGAEDCYPEIQATKNPTKEEAILTAQQAAWDVPSPFGTN